MSAIKKGNAANFVWDLPSGEQYSTVGRNVSVSKKRGGEQAPLPTDDGETDGLVLYDPNTELVVQAILPTTDETPEFGDTVTINTKKFVVMEWNKVWERKNWSKVTITVHAWDAMSLT